MDESVTVRDLRNRSREVLERVAQGETVMVTRDGRPIAELRGVARPPIPAQTLLNRWHHLPRVDPAKLRRDLETHLDSSL